MNTLPSPVSEVAMTASLQRRIFLFGSLGQFLSYAGGMTLVILGCAYFMGPEAPRALFITTVLGAFLGSLPALITSLPARFSIRASGPAADAWLRDLDDQLEQMAYRRAGSKGIRYEKSLPRWMRWAEDGFDITCQDGRIDVTGPLLATRRLRRTLLADQA